MVNGISVYSMVWWLFGWIDIVAAVVYKRHLAWMGWPSAYILYWYRVLHWILDYCDVGDLRYFLVRTTIS